VIGQGSSDNSTLEPHPLDLGLFFDNLMFERANGHGALLRADGMFIDA
jgi:hypothetical protein